MIQGGMFGFPLLLIVFILLLAIQPVRELGLIIASLYMQYRIWRGSQAGVDDPATLKKEDDQYANS